MKQATRNFLPAILVFIIVNSASLFLVKKLGGWGVDYAVLTLGNLLLFSISLGSYLMSAKGLASKNNHAFFRWVYGSFMVKLFVLAGAAFIYIMVAKQQVNKPALFLCMGLYAIYTGIEVSALMKMAKQKKNA